MTENIETAGSGQPGLDQLLEQAAAPGADIKRTCLQIVDRYLTDSGFTELYVLQPDRQRMAEKLNILLRNFSGCDFKEKTIIDLGCGNLGGTEANEGAFCRNEPWFCRLLHQLGFKIIGLDNGILDGEKFTHRQTDLTLPDSLHFIGDQSADAVMADHFFHCEDLLYQKMRNPKLSIKDLRRQLFPQIQRILKKNGFYLENDEISCVRYFTHHRHELEHEQYSIHEVNRLYREIHEEPVHTRIYIAKKISELMFPYLCREYNYAPEDENRDLIEFHCAVILEKIAALLPGLDLSSCSVAEYLTESGSADRLNEPWASRFLEMMGARPLVYRLQGQTSIRPPDNSVDLAISPLIDNLAPQEKEHYSGQIQAALKDDGRHLIRKKRSVETKGKKEAF